MICVFRKSRFMVVDSHGVTSSPLLPWSSLIGHFVQWIGMIYSLIVCCKAQLHKTLIIALSSLGCMTSKGAKEDFTLNLFGLS